MRVRPPAASPSQEEGEGEDSDPHLNFSPLRKGTVEQRTYGFVEKAGSVSMPIAFLRFSIHRDSMGQQLRVRIKRKRRLAYLRRKNTARRAAVTRPAVKQPAQKESPASE